MPLVLWDLMECGMFALTRKLCYAQDGVSCTRLGKGIIKLINVFFCLDEEVFDLVADSCCILGAR